MPFRWNHSAPETGLDREHFNRDESFLDVTGYFANYYKTGVAPEIGQDRLYVTSRNRPRSLTRVWIPSRSAWGDQRFDGFPARSAPYGRRGQSLCQRVSDLPCPAGGEDRENGTDVRTARRNLARRAPVRTRRAGIPPDPERHNRLRPREPAKHRIGSDEDQCRAGAAPDFPRVDHRRGGRRTDPDAEARSRPPSIRRALRRRAGACRTASPETATASGSASGTRSRATTRG